MTENSESKTEKPGEKPEPSKVEDKRRESEGKTFGQKGTEVKK